MDAVERETTGRFAPGNANCWRPGQTGNPRGRPRGASFASALARHALTPVSDRQEMAKIARTIGLDPEQARNLDVVASLFYTVLCRALLRAANSNGRADDKLVGMLQVLLKALDPTELRVSGPGGGPIPIAAVVANVQAALGMRPLEIDATPISDAAPNLDAPASALDELAADLDIPNE